MSTTSCLQRPSTSSNQPPQWMDLEMKFIYLHLFVSLQQMWQLNLPTNISRYLRPARRRTSAKLPLCAIVHCAGSDDTPEFWQYAGKSWIYNKCFSGTNGEEYMCFMKREDYGWLVLFAVFLMWFASDQNYWSLLIDWIGGLIGSDTLIGRSRGRSVWWKARLCWTELTIVIHFGNAPPIDPQWWYFQMIFAQYTGTTGSYWEWEIQQNITFRRERLQTS